MPRRRSVISFAAAVTLLTLSSLPIIGDACARQSRKEAGDAKPPTEVTTDDLVAHITSEGGQLRGLTITPSKSDAQKITFRLVFENKPDVVVTVGRSKRGLIMAFDGEDEKRKRVDINCTSFECDFPIADPKSPREKPAEAR